MHDSIFKRQCEFIIGAQKFEQIPKLHLPEFAFIGRSNVGKSSLVNKIVSRRALARVSQNPGCTRQLNFFELKDTLLLVDLPGYGFAKVSKSQRDSFNILVRQYLRSSKNLQRIFLLLDARHEVKESDIDIMNFLDEYAVTYQLVLTKSDKAKDSSERVDQLKEIQNTHTACHPIVLTTSSVTGDGISELKDSIVELL